MTANQIAYWSLDETKRANLAREAETNRANLARETETHRANVASEGIDISKLAETSRHNKASESIDLGQLGETKRHNKVAESQNRSRINAQNALDYANQQLTDIKRKYEIASQESKLQTDNTTRRQIEEQIKNLEATRDKIAADVRRSDWMNYNEQINTYLRALEAGEKTANDLLRALNPLRR